MKIAALLAVAGVAGAAQAQSFAWSHDVPDGTELMPGDSITVTLTAEFSSAGGEEFQALAATIFDTLNTGGADAGEPLMDGDWMVLNGLDELTGDLTTTDGASMFNTNAGQLTAFGFQTDANPIDVFQFTWTAASPGEVSFETSTASAFIWAGASKDDADDFDITDVVEETSFGWTVIPTPASAALLGFGGLALARRRR